jgi:hypothetical protein
VGTECLKVGAGQQNMGASSTLLPLIARLCRCVVHRAPSINGRWGYYWSWVAFVVAPQQTIQEIVWWEEGIQTILPVHTKMGAYWQADPGITFLWGRISWTPKYTGARGNRARHYHRSWQVAT